MKLEELIDRLQLTVKCGGDRLGTDVTGGYAGDLLSDVMANSNAGNIWVTMQVHVNTVAVAVLKELAAIVIVEGREPAEETLERARQEHMVILTTGLPAFEIAGKLYTLLTDSS
jgi:hypothetical protein